MFVHIMHSTNEHSLDDNSSKQNQRECSLEEPALPEEKGVQ